jgi:hypothetical protein
MLLVIIVQGTAAQFCDTYDLNNGRTTPPYKKIKPEEEAHCIHEGMGVAINIECPAKKRTALLFLLVFWSLLHSILDPGAIGLFGLKTMTFSPSEAASNIS